MSATVAGLEDAYTDADLFEMICQIRGDELDGAGIDGLVHHIRRTNATPDEQALGSFTQRKLKQLSTYACSCPSYRYGDSRPGVSDASGEGKLCETDGHNTDVKVRREHAMRAGQPFARCTPASALEAQLISLMV